MKQVGNVGYNILFRTFAFEKIKYTFQILLIYRLIIKNNH